MADVLKIILTFFLTVVAGNFLASRWQQRNWTEQHRVARIEKELEELKLLVSEIGELGDARRYRTMRLLLNLTSPDIDLNGYIAEYDRIVATWNDRFNSFCVRLALLASMPYRVRLEKTIQPNFVEIGNRLSKLIRIKKQGGTLDLATRTKLIADLNTQNGRLCIFSRDLLRLLMKRRKDAYQGKVIEFSPRSIQFFSTWYLFKEVFQANHPPLTIDCSSSDFESPNLRWL